MAHLLNHNCVGLCSQIPKDCVLFAITILVVKVDLLIILIGTAIPSSRLNATSTPDAQHLTATNVSGRHRHLQIHS